MLYKMIQIEEDKQYLLAQLQKYRARKMGGIDKILAKQEYELESKKACLEHARNKLTKYGEIGNN